MGGVLHRYTVMQQSQWAGRRFFSAQDRRTGQAVYLIEEPVTGTPGRYNHPGLPPVEELAADGDVRWLVASMPEGETLEDLRRAGTLTEKEIAGALLSVLDGLMGLAELEPPLVPAYLDPACIKRDWMGRWTLDYLALAQATEARRRQTPPLGVYPFGALLYWLATGEAARFTRVQVRRVPGNVTPVLQFITMRCLGQAYPGLAELRADVARAVKAHDFRPLAEQIQRSAAGTGGPTPVPPRRVATNGGGPATPDPAPERGQAPAPARTAAGQSKVRIAGMDPRTFMEQHRVPVASRIPLDDRPWALPPRPPEGYRKYTVPPPPNPVVQAAVRWSMLTLFGLAVASATGWGAYRMGLIPDDLLPPPLRRAAPADIPAEAGVHIGARLSPDPALPPAPQNRPAPQPSPGGPAQGPPSGLPEPLTPDQGEPELPSGPNLPPAPDGASREDPFVAAPVDHEPSQEPPGTGETRESPRPEPEPAPRPQPEPRPAPRPEPDPVPRPQPEPEPDDTPAPQPAPQPEPPEQEPEGPAPGSVAYMDKQLGAVPVNFYLDGRFLREVYMFPHDRNPYISLEALNEVTGRSIIWVPVSGGRIRLLDDDLHVLTYSYYRIRDRVLLKLGPELQTQLGLQLIAYNEEGIFFAAAP